MKQTTLGSTDWVPKYDVTCRGKFLTDTDRRGPVQCVVTGPAVGDITRPDDLRHGRARALSGAQAYGSEDYRQHGREAGLACRVNCRARPGRVVTEQENKMKRSRSRHRARGAPAFRAVKNV
jgi:hypothetical protein